MSNWVPVTFKEFYFENSRKYVEAVLNDYLVWNSIRPTPFIEWYRRHHGDSPAQPQLSALRKDDGERPAWSLVLLRHNQREQGLLKVPRRA